MADQFLDLSLIRQYFIENNYLETLRTFERESGLFFDRIYFKELVMNGNWDEAEKYLSPFINLASGSDYSSNIYFELMKEKYLEALEKNDLNKALEVLKKDLRFLVVSHPDVHGELTSVLTLTDFRKHPVLSYYKDSTSGRVHAMDIIDRLIDLIPDFKDKLVSGINQNGNVG